MSNRLNPTLIDGRIVARDLPLPDSGDSRLDERIRGCRMDAAAGQINGYTVF